MTDRTGLSRGDRNRNSRLARLRVLVPPGNAIVGIDLASDKQAAVVTDHDSRVLDQLAAQRGLALVCVQPLLVYRAREGEDLTFDKSDPKDAVIIARLAAELHHSLTFLLSTVAERSLPAEEPTCRAPFHITGQSRAKRPPGFT